MAFRLFILNKRKNKVFETGLVFFFFFPKSFYIVTYHDGNTESGENVFELLSFPMLYYCLSFNAELLILVYLRGKKG